MRKETRCHGCLAGLGARDFRTDGPPAGRPDRCLSVLPGATGSRNSSIESLQGRNACRLCRTRYCCGARARYDARALCARLHGCKSAGAHPGAFPPLQRTTSGAPVRCIATCKLACLVASEAATHAHLGAIYVLHLVASRAVSHARAVILPRTSKVCMRAGRSTSMASESRLGGCWWAAAAQGTGSHLWLYCGVCFNGGYVRSVPCPLFG